MLGEVRNIRDMEEVVGSIFRTEGHNGVIRGNKSFVIRVASQRIEKCNLKRWIRASKENKLRGVGREYRRESNK